jgi:peroxiredoxin
MSLKGIAKLVFNTAFRKEFPMVNVGADAPRFEALDHLGRPVSLDGLRGRFIVLWFFPKADTPG